MGENPSGLSTAVVILVVFKNLPNQANAQGMLSSPLLLILVGRERRVYQRRFLSLS